MDLLLLILLRPDRLVPILFWRLLGKRLRARGRLNAALAGLPLALEREIRRQGENDLTIIEQATSAGHVVGVFVHLHIEPGSSEKELRAAIRSVRRQSYRPRCIIITGPQTTIRDLEGSDEIRVLKRIGSSRIEGLTAALAEAKEAGARWIVPCVAKNALTQHAIAGFCAHLIGGCGEVSADVVYGDICESSNGLAGVADRRYWLKPQWDQRMFMSQDYVTASCVLAIEPALSALHSEDQPQVRSLSELVLRMSETGTIEHCPRVTARTRINAWSALTPDHTDAIKALLGTRGSVADGPFGTKEVQWRLQDPLPSVSIIIATRDRVELLRTCIEGVLEGTDYPALDVIIVDNESIEPETLSYMEDVSADPRVQVVRWPHPFNYSAINNFAARHATGEFLCLLNNDIEVIEPSWLTEMIREAVQPGVGAVGAQLLYPDRSIQHAGVALGIGNAAGHAHRGLPQGEAGYFAQALIARGASAVTAACLIVRKEHFDAVGGLDERDLAVAYNDVDFCLKLQEQGLSNIYTPRATLIHHESKSRGLDFAPEHLKRYMNELGVLQKRWNTKTVIDPWHHSKLDRGSENYKT